MPALDFPASPTNGQVFGNWIYSTAKGAWQSKPLTPAKTVNSPTAPSSPADGDQWFNTNTGQLFIYYTDANGSQWVESRAPITADGYISPNYIINGGMDIWQRGTSGFTGGVFAADRWRPGTAGTWERSTDVPVNVGINYSLKNNSSVSNWLLQHAVELNVTGSGTQFRGVTHTFSFYAKVDSGKTFNAQLYYADTSVGGNQVTIGTSVLTGTGAWERYSFQLDPESVSPVGSNTCIRIAIFNLDSITFTNVLLTGVQLEEGTVATPFRRNANSLQGELAACQRYFVAYQANTIRTMNPYFTVNLGSGDQFVMNSTFPVQMRRTPDNPTTAAGGATHSFTYLPSNAGSNATVVLRMISNNSQSFRASYSSTDNGGNTLATIYASGYSNNPIWVNAEF